MAHCETLAKPWAYYLVITLPDISSDSHGYKQTDIIGTVVHFDAKVLRIWSLPFILLGWS